MTPDDLVAELAHIPHLVEVALKHDLKCAYGEPGNTEERERADREFKADLLADGAVPAVAVAMYLAVRLFGDTPIKTSFCWAFARK